LGRWLVAAVGALALAASGCGGGGGVSSGAIVTVYVSVPLCAGAKRELARERGRAGSVRVRAACLAETEKQGRLDLAAIGANARRATQDSTTVAYLEPPNPAAARFTHPILETAGIARISRSSGKAAMARLLQAIEAADTGSLRESVREALRKT